MSDPDSLLIVRLSSIGDVVHTLPAWQEIRRRWPRARIGWAVESAAADLIRRLPDTAVYELPLQQARRSWWSPRAWTGAWRVVRRIRRDRYAVALDFQGLLKSALIGRCSGARLYGLHAADLRERTARLLYHASAAPAAPGTHVVHRGLNLLRVLGGEISGEIRFPALAGAQDRARVRRWLAEAGIGAPIVLLHPAANWPSKRYPPERWVEVGRALARRTDAQVLWVWGPGEGDAVAALAARAGAGNRPAPRMRLPELAALLAHATLFVGGDSGPLHLAVACGTPVVALFGPTDPARLGPLSPADTIVRHVLSCSHCHRRTCPYGTVECLEAIPPGEIIEAALVDRRALGDS